MENGTKILLSTGAIFLLVVAIIGGIFYFVNVPTTQKLIDVGDGTYCEDSDGFEPFEEGWIRLIIPEIDYKDEKVYDYCIDDDTVGEYYCDTSLGVALESYDCEAECDNGQCLECEDRDEKRCYNDDVYWYNSCGDREERAESCEFGCSNGECEIVQSECSSGEEKCEGTTFFKCVSDEWFEVGQKDGECGYTIPNDGACSQDVKECSDGSFVSRNPDNNCEFDSCPTIEDPEINTKQIAMILGIILLILVVLVGIVIWRKSK